MIWESEWYKYKAPEGTEGAPSFGLRVSARETNPRHVIVQVRAMGRIMIFPVPVKMVRAFISDLVSACMHAERAPPRGTSAEEPQSE